MWDDSEKTLDPTTLLVRVHKDTSWNNTSVFNSRDKGGYRFAEINVVVDSCQLTAADDVLPGLSENFLYRSV